MDLGATIWLLISSKRSNQFLIDYQGAWYDRAGEGLFKIAQVNYQNFLGPHVSLNIDKNLFK